MIFILVGFFLILFLPIFLILYSNGFIKKYHHINFSDNKQSIKEIKRDISYKLIEENEAEGMLGKASSKVNGMKKNIPNPKSNISIVFRITILALVPLFSFMIYFFNSNSYLKLIYNEIHQPKSKNSFSKNSEETNKEMILEMVENLEKKLILDSKNLEGWKMLARSKLILGDLESAKEAYSNAKLISSNDLEVLEGEAQVELLLSNGVPNIKIVNLYKKILKIDSENIMGMLIIANHESENGNIDIAKRMYEKILKRLPDNIPEYNTIKSKIFELNKTNN